MVLAAMGRRRAGLPVSTRPPENTVVRFNIASFGNKSEIIEFGERPKAAIRAFLISQNHFFFRSPIGSRFRKNNKKYSTW